MDVHIYRLILMVTHLMPRRRSKSRRGRNVLTLYSAPLLTIALLRWYAQVPIMAVAEGVEPADSSCAVTWEER